MTVVGVRAGDESESKSAPTVLKQTKLKGKRLVANAGTQKGVRSDPALGAEELPKNEARRKKK